MEILRIELGDQVAGFDVGADVDAALADLAADAEAQSTFVTGLDVPTIERACFGGR